MADNRLFDQTGTALTDQSGANYLFDQGRMARLCPTDDVDDAAFVEQILTDQTGAPTALTFTVVQGGLSLGTVYVFEQNIYGAWNTNGFAVTLAAGGAGSLVFAVRRPQMFTSRKVG